ncbi:MAG: hypothetical protein ABJG78_09960 [Cyclobacteriaceae bacterium]
MKWFRKYLLPGLVFQSVLIGGGYGTGRELVEFFMTAGPVAGYLGMLISTILWGLVMSVTYELARLTGSYDYKSFISQLLGKAWVIYEILLVLISILVVSVMASAAGELSNQALGIDPLVGSITMMLLVGLIIFFGTDLIEKVFSVWSIALYVVYIVLIIVTWTVFDEEIKAVVSGDLKDSSWFIGGISYAGYNIAILPALLYSAKYLETRREAIASGFLGGLIGILPAILVYTAMLSQYPEIVSESIPSNFLLSQLDVPVFNGIFQVILFGTFIETGIGYIHGFNERIAGIYKVKDAEMPSYMRVVVAGLVLCTAVFLANALGLIGLIAEGYGIITWGFIAVYVVPVLTVGVVKIVRYEG